MRPYPSDDQERILKLHDLLAPPNGEPFHMHEYFKLFSESRPEDYLPNERVLQQLGNLAGIASIMGPFGVGKNGAKSAAVNLAYQRENQHEVPGGLHTVRNGTTRKPEFRDGDIETDEDYIFCHTADAQRTLVRWFNDRELVQWAQPRGDHVYFSWSGSYPNEGFALLDTVLPTLDDINRIVRPIGKTAIGIYRSVETFDAWMERIKARGDILDATTGKVIDFDNYKKRMKEAESSLTEALDNRDKLKFFETEQKVSAGRAVINILTGKHPDSMQKRGILGAERMLRGIKELRKDLPLN